ncbi:UNVERIFIED_CONTAM: hypothetical protein K2H54_027430 [Gekko kuhli]
MALCENNEERIELGENNIKGEMSVEQLLQKFQKALLEEMQKGIKKAFQDLRENRQFVTTAEDKDGVSEQSIQEEIEEEAQHDEPLIMDIQRLTRRNLQLLKISTIIKTPKGDRRKLMSKAMEHPEPPCAPAVAAVQVLTLARKLWSAPP